MNVVVATKKNTHGLVIGSSAGPEKMSGKITDGETNWPTLIVAAHSQIPRPEK